MRKTNVDRVKPGQVRLNSTYDRKRHICVVTVTGERFETQGVSVKHPTDKPHPQTGLNVACARALRGMADLLDAESGVNTK